MDAYVVHNIGDRRHPNYASRELIRKTDGLLTFDGIYKSVWENRDLLKGREFILFVMWKYIGGNNEFDSKMPREEFCTIEELRDILKVGHGRVGYHTYSHPDLRKVPDWRMRLEVLKPPQFWELKEYEINDFAYPYGKVNDRTERAARDAGYHRAWCAGKYGDDTILQLKRKVLCNR